MSLLRVQIRLFFTTAHISHQGIVRTKSLERSCTWWSKMDSQIEDSINGCNIHQQAWHLSPQTLGTFNCVEKPR